jgi:hypothetical protein
MVPLFVRYEYLAIGRIRYGGVQVDKGIDAGSTLDGDVDGNIIDAALIAALDECAESCSVNVVERQLHRWEFDIIGSEAEKADQFFGGD